MLLSGHSIAFRIDISTVIEPLLFSGQEWIRPYLFLSISAMAAPPNLWYTSSGSGTGDCDAGALRVSSPLH